MRYALKDRDYAPIKRRFPHQWWHWFYTDLLSWADDGSCEKHYCKKCNKIFMLEADVLDVERVK